MHAQQTVGLFQYDQARSFNGLTMFSAMGSTKAHLINNCGRSVHSWPLTTRAAFSVYLLNDGSILVPEVDPSVMKFNLGMSGGRLERVSWDGKILWSVVLGNDSIGPHHDICPMPNGNILVIAWEVKSREQVIAAGRPDSLAGECWTEKIMEIKPIGTNGYEVVWEWHLWDHLVQDRDPMKPHFGRRDENPRRFDINAFIPPVTFADWVHYNSVSYDAERDEIVLSARQPSEIYVIDHSTTTAEAAGSTGGKRGFGGDFLFRWGNDSMVKYTNFRAATLGHQHSAHIIRRPEDPQFTIMVFNNDAGNFGGPYSSVDVIMPPLEADGSYAMNDGVFGPDGALWRYVAPAENSFYSALISGAQRLENGNVLVCEGLKGRFFEIDTAKTIVWEYVNPDFQGKIATQGDKVMSNSVFRCTRFPYSHPAFVGKNLVSGAPLESSPIDDQCLLASVTDELRNRSMSESTSMGTELCSGTTQIDVASSGTVRIVLYALNGTIVRELFNGPLEAGTHSINLSSASLVPGVYIVLAQSPAGETFKKLLVD